MTGEIARALVLSALLVGFWGAGGGPARAEEPHRVLLVTIDTLRADHVGAYGGPVPTPALDRLAAEGVVVEQVATPTPTTGPAHASLMTGLHPWRHGTLANGVPLDPTLPTLAQRFSERGVDTAAFVSSYILHRRFGFFSGFDTYVFEPTELYVWRGERRKFWARGESTVAAAMEWITQHTERPFFVWVHLFDPHAPYRPPVGFAVPPDDPVDLAGKSVPEGVNNRRDLRDRIRAYRGEVRYADAQVGKLVERLRLLGLLDQTAVVVTSDHGEGLGDHNHLLHGRNLYQELVHVPLIVRAPGVPAGSRLAGPVQLEDLAPTILALGGVSDDRPRDGLDLTAWLRGASKRSPREWILGRRRPYPQTTESFYALRGSSKWIGPLDGAGQLFSLDSDPQELAGHPGQGAPEILRQSVGDAANPLSRSLPDTDPEVRDALEALGYVEPGSADEP